MEFKKSDLKYEYKWTVTNGDDPKITGKKDSVFLNRNEGYEMLDFINSFELNNVAIGIKIEKMIKEDLPSDIKSRKKISKWIADNWDN